MAREEIKLGDDYGKILAWTQNILGANAESSPGEGANRALYFATATIVLVAQRLDHALGKIDTSVTDAESQLRSTLQQATKMFLDAADRNLEFSKQQADQATRYARQLTLATWVLAAATVALVIVTLALLLKP